MSKENTMKPDKKPPAITDSDRLCWLKRHISGDELRRIGVVMNWSGDPQEFRDEIDKQIEQGK